MRIIRILFCSPALTLPSWMPGAILFVVLGLSCLDSRANTIASPDGNIITTVGASSGNLVYSVAYRGVTVIETSPLGIIVNNTNIGTGVTVGSFFAYSTNETFTSRQGIHTTVTNAYLGQIIGVTHVASGVAYNINFRVWNSGVAFRYELTNTTTKSITSETSGFLIPSGSTVWSQIATDDYQGIYYGSNITSLAVGTIMGPPAVVQLAGTNGFLALTESVLGAFGNPYLNKVADGTGRLLQVVYPINEDGTTGTSLTGPINTPWNLIMVGADLNMIVNNDMVESLAASPDPALFPQGGATSWATAGRSVWDYLRPWPGGITYTNAMTNSLWASRMGFECNTIDEGWANWNGGNPWPQVQQVVNFSHSLGVKVILWKTSSELVTAANRAAFFQQLQTYGVDGFKADFFDYNSVTASAKERVQLEETILREAAPYHLLANFHGTSKPTGLFRTYPNLINYEAVYGKEQWPNPWMVVSVPVTRFLAGPADFTPMEFGGNAAFEIANVVNMPAPIITFAERSDGIAQSAFASLIRTIPCQWDQTIVLSQTQLGQTTATARRKGQDWYIGIMNAVATNYWNIPLTFLASNTVYQADIVRQDSTALERTNVTAASTLSVSITSTNGSGFVAHIYQPPPFTVSANYLLAGSIIGTSGSWGNSGNTITNVFDGNLATYFDGPDASGDWAGLDLGSSNQKVIAMIRYCPRPTWAGRMVTGVFQGANTANFSDAVNLWTVGYFPPDGSFTTVTLTNRSLFRYIRYLSPVGGYCNIAEAQFYGGTNPPSPTGINATAGSNQITLNWTASAGMVYTLMRSTNSGGPYTVIATNLSTSALVDTNVINGQPYFYVAMAVNPVGLASLNSTEVTTTSLGPPQAPLGINALAGTNRTITLTWSTAFNASNYNVKRSTVSGGPYANVTGTTTTNFTDANLANGTTYFYVVSATNAQGESLNSTEVTATPGGYKAWIQGFSPLGYWRLNEASGITAADSSGNGLDGKYQLAVTPGGSGIVNPPYFGFEPGNLAAIFNGAANSWVSLPGLNLNSATVTFSLWIYPFTATQPGATGLIFCRDGVGTTSGFDFNPAGTQLGYTWNNDTGTYGWNSGLTPPANQWSFVALVVTPTNATLYLNNTNGQLSATVAHTHTLSAFSGETRIGNDANSTGRTFSGSLCEAAIFPQALSSAQISTLYKAAAGLFYNPVITNTWNGAQLVLTWPYGGQLLNATNISGPWITNVGATSPFGITPSRPVGFYRVQLQ